MSLETEYGDGCRNQITLKINDKNYTVRSRDVPLDTSLNAFIRDHAQLPGTKYMCKEGGCGACVVTVTSRDLQTNKDTTYAVNSCLFKVWSCNNTNVTTIEKAKKYKHPGAKATIPDQLAASNGSQCGYCSPAMVMNMYGLLKGSKDGKITETDIEKSFAGNLCRCTGYKPILEGFRQVINPSADNILDIEEVGCLGKCARRRIESECEDYESCFVEYALAPENRSVTTKDGKCWKIPRDVKEIMEILQQIGSASYMLINGNTAAGVAPKIFRDTPVQNYINIRNIKELTTVLSLSDEKLVVGANITISDFIRALQQAQTKSNYKYASELVEHLDLVANVPVRNTGSLAGNLMLKYKMLQQGQMFQSDVFLLLELVSATIEIAEKSGVRATIKPSDLVNGYKMEGKVMTKITLPAIDSNLYLIRTYKIMPRAQNAPAAVNAGFLFKMKSPSSTVVDCAVIVYGGINPTFIHASNTEKYLAGKDISKENVLQTAIQKLYKDIPIGAVPDKPTAAYLYPPEYRQNLAVNLYYKTILYFNKKRRVSINPLYKTGYDKLEDTRGISRGDTDVAVPTDKARGQRIPKLEAYIQCRGEAEYVNDIPVIHGQLYGAMVIAPKGPGVLGKIDISKAQRTTGFVNFFSAKDIPGKNQVLLTNKLVTPEVEELFASYEVKYAGQPVGIVLGTSQDTANALARLVEVDVRESQEKLLTIDDVFNKYGGKYPNERILLTELPPPVELSATENGEADEASNDDVQVKGELNMGSQYHFSMELQTCAVIPIEDGQFDVYSSTQWPLSIQEAVALLLGILDTQVNVVVRRVGGAYGAKVTRAVFAAGACALASHLTQKPVRMVMDLEANTRSMGKRCALKCFYDLTADKSTGKITKINKLDLLDDKGHTLNEPIFIFIPGGLLSCYNIQHLVYPPGGGTKPFNVYSVKTQTPSSAWCRAPGSLEGVTIIETIMNTISEKLNLDPIKVRLSNIDQAANKPFYDFFTKRIQKIDFDKKKQDVEKFNQNNKWRKQGISLIPMSFSIEFYYQFYCTVSIHEADGSISISHGGVEIGQGVNTKAAVAAAFVFGLPDVSNIRVKPTNIVFSPNATLTGGSMTSDAVSYACMRCCKAIKARLDLLIKERSLSKDIKWPDLIQTAYTYGLNLNSTYMWKLGDKADPDVGELSNYKVGAVCSTIVELDVLTGQHIIREVTLYEDAGQSFAPNVDLGQIQGAFIMGMGYFTSEEILYDPTDGNLINSRTWTYDVPGFLDIPEVFNVHVEDDDDLGRLRPTDTKLAGVMGAKASGEPPLCLSSTVFFAIREAIKSARKSSQPRTKLENFYPPATIAQKVKFSDNDVKEFKITS